MPKLELISGQYLYRAPGLLLCAKAPLGFRLWSTLVVQLCLGTPLRQVVLFGREKSHWTRWVAEEEAVAESCPGKNSLPCHQRALSPGTGLRNFKTDDPLRNDNEALHNIGQYRLVFIMNICMVENLYGCSIGAKSPYKLKPHGQIPWQRKHQIVYDKGKRRDNTAQVLSLRSYRFLWWLIYWETRYLPRIPTTNPWLCSHAFYVLRLLKYQTCNAGYHYLRYHIISDDYYIIFNLFN